METQPLRPPPRLDPGRVTSDSGDLVLTVVDEGPVARLLVVGGLDDLLEQPVAGLAGRSGPVAPLPVSAYGGGRSDRVATSTIDV